MIWLLLLYWFIVGSCAFTAMFWYFLRFSNPNWPKIEILLTVREICDILVCSTLVGLIMGLIGLGLTALVIG